MAPSAASNVVFTESEDSDNLRLIARELAGETRQQDSNSTLTSLRPAHRCQGAQTRVARDDNRSDGSLELARDEVGDQARGELHLKLGVEHHLHRVVGLAPVRTLTPSSRLSRWHGAPEEAGREDDREVLHGHAVGLSVGHDVAEEARKLHDHALGQRRDLLPQLRHSHARRLQADRQAACRQRRHAAPGGPGSAPPHPFPS
jgi:hypothetical protein